jgi:hypothetical protein
MIIILSKRQKLQIPKVTIKEICVIKPSFGTVQKINLMTNYPVCGKAYGVQL